MTKRDLVIRIAGEMKRPQQEVSAILQKCLDYITEALVRGESVEFRDFGVFEVKLRKPRIGRNPNRPEQTVAIPPRKIVKFKAGKQMKASVLKS